MQSVPPEVWAAFERQLDNMRVPAPQRADSRKWERFYLDFCHKSQESSANNGAITFTSPMSRVPSNRPQRVPTSPNGFRGTSSATPSQVICCWLITTYEYCRFSGHLAWEATMASGVGSCAGGLHGQPFVHLCHEGEGSGEATAEFPWGPRDGLVPEGRDGGPEARLLGTRAASSDVDFRPAQALAYRGV